MSKSHVVVLSLVCALSTCAAASQVTRTPLYRNANAPIPDRVRDLPGRMTLEEKVAQLESGLNAPLFAGVTPPSIFEGDHLNELLAQKLLSNGLGTYSFLDEFTSLVDGPEPPRTGAHHRNLLQAWVLTNTRLGIPIMFHGEALHGAVVKGATSVP
jgi:beta-glucosidase